MDIRVLKKAFWCTVPHAENLLKTKQGTKSDCDTI